MSCKQLLIIYTVTFWASALEEHNLPCNAGSSPEVFWPDIDNGTCSTSVPGCINPKGFLEIRCCIEGEPTEVNCVKNDSIRDPRCLGNMRSTLNQKNIRICYEFVNHTTFPYECTSRTGRMMAPNFELLTTLGGSDTGIWLPIEQYEDAFRYSTINNFYMDSFGTAWKLNSSTRCMILLGGATKAVSCFERHLGICLDFPFIIYQIPWSQFDDLLFDVKDSCSIKAYEDYFCLYFKQRYDMNLVYFSSRYNVEEPYIILQKSNSRFILQIRKHDMPRSDSSVNLHVALADADWNIFLNTSFPFTFYNSSNQDIYKAPKVILSAYPDSTNITIYKTNSINIKWTQPEEYTQYIYCFSSTAPDYQLEKYEVLNNFQTDLHSKDGVIWCEAFDFDLHVFSSNVITVGVQTIFHYISEMTVTIGKIESCNSHYVRIRIIKSFALSENDKYFTFDISDLRLIQCILDELATVNITVYWYPRYAALRIDFIEQEYFKLQKLIENISDKSAEANLNILTLQYLRHSNYCLKETTVIGNFSFAWHTTLVNTKGRSYPYCYHKSPFKTLIFERTCTSGPTGSFWSTTVDDCEPTSNLTQLLEIYSSDQFGQAGILQNLNAIIRKYYSKFNVSDVYSLSKIITKLKAIPSNIDKGLESLSSLVNNLHFIRTDVLKISQDVFQTTDSIMNSSDSLYLSTEGSQNLAESNHCYYTINFTEHPNAVGVLVRNSGTNRQIKLLESVLLPVELQQDDSFEAAIFLDEKSLQRCKQDYIKTVKFSIFFNNYLFDVNHPSTTSNAIYKILLPDKNEVQPLTSLLTMRNQKKSAVCSCWKYANDQKSISESKWYRTTKFDIDSSSICVITSVSYCTIFTKESPDTSGYVSRLSVQYWEPRENNSELTYIVYNMIGDILYGIQHQLLDQVTYEVEHEKNMDLTESIHEIIVVWIPHKPIEIIEDIERQYRDLRLAIEISTRTVNNVIINRMILEYLRHKRYCLYDVYYYNSMALIFETTPLNKTTVSVPPCYTSKGIYKRKCIGNFSVGSYWEPLQNTQFIDCSSNVTKFLDYLLNHFSDEEANEVLDGLTDMTAVSGHDFNSRDIFLLAEILFLISGSAQNISTQNVSSLTSNIQEMDKNALIEAQVEFNATDKILYSLDRIFLNSNVSENKEKNFYTVELTNLNESVGLLVQSNGNEYDVFKISGNVSKFDELGRYTNFEGAVFFNNFNRNDTIKVSIFLQDVLFVDSAWKHRVSVIFGVLLPNHDNMKMNGEIELVFKNDESRDKACAFWKYGMENGNKISGMWKNESEPNEKSEYSTCKFNHTTHFAMLIDDSSSDPEYLEIVTKIGCVLSSLGLLGILITGVIFERWRKNLGNIILMNFVFTVLIQICLFYFSGSIHSIISRSESCILVGALLHYSVISEFCWMLIIAILQFKRFVQVLTRPPKYVLLKSISGGWGFPLIPVLSILLLDPSNYTYSKTGLCYPSKLGLYLGVWLPILLITLINFIIFAYIMYSICNRKTECVDTVSNEVIFQWRLAVLLFFMLGLTWSFAFIGEFMLKEIFLYLFCITSTLQGFIMFLFFILFNERTRLLYSTLLKRK